MFRIRDSRGRFMKDIVEQLSSPCSNCETLFEIESSDNPSKPQTIENVGNPPPNDPPHDNLPHDNPLYANRSMHEYKNPTRTSSLSCILFQPNTPHQECKPGII